MRLKMNKSFLKDVIAGRDDRKVDETFGNFLYGYNKVKSLTESLDSSELSKELTLFIESDRSLNDQIPDVKRTLFKHFKRADYDSNLAERAWNRVVSEAAIKYAEEVGHEPRLWEELFPEDVRNEVVEGFEQKFYNDLKQGKVNTEELFNESN